MESEKKSDLEEKDKQDFLVTNKELVAGIKSKVDLSTILDSSLQGQDFTIGLHAEVDLDESVEKVDNLTEKCGDHDEDINKQTDTLQNGHREDSETVNEVNNSETNRLTVDKGDLNQIELQNCSVEDKREPFHDNSDLKDTVETEDIMGNNLEGNDGTETSVNENSEDSNTSGEVSKVKSDELDNEGLDKSENNNEKDTQDYENLNPAHNGGQSDNHQIDSAQEPETDGSGEVTKTNDSEEKLDYETDVDTGAIVSDEGEMCENKQNESLEIDETEDKDNDLEDSSDIGNDSMKDVTVVDFNEKETEGDEKDEDAEKIEEEVIDREKIQNFIMEVINDLHGIVIETEKCDSVVNDMLEESTRSELVSEMEVKGVDRDFTEPTGGAVDLMEIAIEGCDDNSDNLKVNDNESEGVCALVIEETTDATVTLENSVSIAENTPKSDVNTSYEDSKTSETDIEKSDALMDTCDPQPQNSCSIEDSSLHSVEGDTEVLEVSLQNTLPVKTKENDLKMTEEELKTTQAALKKSQRSLQDERSKHNQDVMTLKLQLYRSQMELKQQKLKSEKRLTEIMSHLVMLESRLRQEQLRLKRESKDKNNVIENQKKEIMKLKDQNEQLLNAIKEIYAKGGMNGYMRENRRKNGNQMESFENSAKGTRDKKGHTGGKLGSMKDKFMAKNRSSLELNSFSLEKYLIKDQRLCSSQEDLHRLGDERRRSIPTIDERVTQKQRRDKSPKDRPHSDNTEYKNGGLKKQVRYSQNFFSDAGSPNYEMNKSVSESSHLSESTNSSSGVYSLSDHDLSMHNDSITNGHQGNNDYIGDDDDDDRIFSFSSTHINTVIAEEEAMGPIMSHSGQMMSMGSMPMLANLKEENMGSGKNRPHSLSSVDLASIQQQAQNLARFENRLSPNSPPNTEMSTPPSSPSYIQGKNELTPFQTFKTMFRRKGSSKNKSHKKRSVSLSQTTNKEYSDALKKHFQKYDMS